MHHLLLSIRFISMKIYFCLDSYADPSADEFSIKEILR